MRGYINDRKGPQELGFTQTMATYKHLFLLLLGLMFLSVDVLGARATYSAWYKDGLGGQPHPTQRLGKIKDEHVQPLLDHTHTWSHGR